MKFRTILFLLALTLSFTLVSTSFAHDDTVDGFGYNEIIEYGDKNISYVTKNYTINGTEVIHNELTGIQGGMDNEHYHVQKSWYDELELNLFDWITNNVDNLVNYYLKTEVYNKTEVDDLIINYDNSTIARIGNCPSGYVVQNTTTGGVQCIEMEEGSAGVSNHSELEELEWSKSGHIIDTEINMNRNQLKNVTNFTTYATNESVFSILDITSENINSTQLGENNSLLEIKTSDGEEAFKISGDGFFSSMTTGLFTFLEKVFLKGGLQVEGDLEIFNTTYTGAGEEPITLKLGFLNSDYPDDHIELTYLSGAYIATFNKEIYFEKPVRFDEGFRFRDDVTPTTHYLIAENGTVTYKHGVWGHHSPAIWRLQYADLVSEYSDAGLEGGNIRAERNLVTDYRFGVGIDTPNYPAEILGNISNISLYVSDEISATGYNTRTSVFEPAKGNAISFIKNFNHYKDDKGKIQHDKFYGYKGMINATDMSRPVIERTTEIIEDEDGNEMEIIKERVTYPYQIEVGQVSLDEEVNVLRQALFDVTTMMCNHRDFQREELCQDFNE